MNEKVSTFLFIIHWQSLRRKVYNCRVFYSLTIPSPGSGVLDDILDVKESNSQNLTSNYASRIVFKTKIHIYRKHESGY